MVIKYHNSDFQGLPSEDSVMDAMRKAGVTPGDYMMPHCVGGSKAMKDPVFLEKFNKGPVAIMTIMPPGQWAMGKSLTQWFIFCIVVSVFAAYIAGRALGPGQNYLEVFRFAGTTAFAAYTLGGVPGSIWYRRKWSTTIKNTFDGLLYGLATGGVFGAMWPGA